MAKSKFEIIRTVKKDEIPSRGKRINYSRIHRALATLEVDEGIALKIEKKHLFSGIKKSVLKEFKRHQFSFTTRTAPDGITIMYIIRER